MITMNIIEAVHSLLSCENDCDAFDADQMFGSTIPLPRQNGCAAMLYRMRRIACRHEMHNALWRPTDMRARGA